MRRAPSTNDTLTDETINLIVERSEGSHKQSIYRRLLGLPVKGAAGRRVDRVLVELGLKPSKAA